MKNKNGFTLIELMTVIAIIGILASIAIPQFSAYQERAFVSEGYLLADPIRDDVVEYYSHTGFWPEDNYACGLPVPEFIQGKYVKEISINKGRIIILFGEESRGYSGETITLTPDVKTADQSIVVTWNVSDSRKLPRDRSGS